MPALQTFQARKFGPAASTITLATKGGAVLGGCWISAKGTTPSISAYDTSSATPSAGNIRVGSTVIAALGLADMMAHEYGTGLTVKVASCTGTIFWRPSSAGV